MSRSDALTPDVRRAQSVVREWVLASTRAVAFTGAGISTESGIPDFRSPSGLWTQMKPIDFHDYVASEAVRVEAWKRKMSLGQTIEKAQPNRGHKAVADLVQQGRVASVITQNVDNLHQNSGVPSTQIIELHGNATYAKCLDCELHYDFDAIYAQFEATGCTAAPKCTACQGIIKTATISFGQAMPEAEIARAEVASLSSDLFLALGTSLQVYPAAGFPMLAKHNGARLVIVNRESTPLDEYADIVIHGELGTVLTAINDSTN